ncbi:MAG: DUF1800 domain-containing protein, partial [bacterium]
MQIDVPTKLAATAVATDAPFVVSADVNCIEVEARPTRRAFFATVAALCTGLLAPKSASAQKIHRPKGRPSTPAVSSLSKDILAAPSEWSSAVTRLLRRISYSPSANDVATARTLGFHEYVEQQLNYGAIDDSAVETFVAANYPLLGQTTDQLFGAKAAVVQAQLQEATLYRAAMSNRQLYERTVELWSQHFNIYFLKVGYLRAIDLRDVIRANAMGSFRDLLYASAQGGAMIAYHDQHISRSGAPNENYAREIMELHTLGVSGGYTQTDVAEMSRVLTGWTIAGRGDFAFNPDIHDWGEKSVLGVAIPAGSPAIGAAGIKEGERMLDVLLAHPSTATFIATKMLRWFIAYDPSPEQIAAVAATYTATSGDIKAMLRTTLNPEWLVAAPMKHKRPFHFVASCLRAT